MVNLVGVKFYVNTYMFVSRECTSGQNQAIMIANKSRDNIVKFKYCRTTLTDLNSMKEEVKEDLTGGNACYISVPNKFVSQFAIQMYESGLSQ
jgi:hypothetical protein